MQKIKVFTYDLSPFLKADEQVLAHLWHIGVCSDTASFICSSTSILTLPINAALDLTLEVARILAGQQGHLDVAVRVGLQLTLHRLKEELVTAKHSLDRSMLVDMQKLRVEKCTYHTSLVFWKSNLSF